MKIAVEPVGPDDNPCLEVKMRRPHLILSRLALACALALPAGLCALPTLAQDAPAGIPEPDLVTKDWKLKFTYAHPETFAYEQADGTVKWYWYMTYKVVNETDEPIRYTPDITVSDDQGNITTANRGISVLVFRALREYVRNPLLLSPAGIPGQIFPGEDYAREGVAIWPVSNRDVDAFAVFFGGIYGETKVLKDPTTGEPIMIPATNPRTGEPRTDRNGDPVMIPVEVNRVRMIRYDSPGTLERPQEMQADLIEEKDVMR